MEVVSKVSKYLLITIHRLTWLYKNNNKISIKVGVLGNIIGEHNLGNFMDYF